MCCYNPLQEVHQLSLLRHGGQVTIAAERELGFGTEKQKPLALGSALYWNLPTEGPKTLNGLILEYLEEIPENKVSLRVEGYPLEIIETGENMIKTVRIMPDYYTEPQSNIKDA